MEMPVPQEKIPSVIIGSLDRNLLPSFRAFDDKEITSVTYVLEVDVFTKRKDAKEDAEECQRIEFASRVSTKPTER